MNNETITLSILKEADQHFDAAYEQYCKPEEDLVPYAICKGSYEAARRYLRAFLLNQGVQINDDVLLKDELVKCREIDPEFNKMNLDLLIYGNSHCAEVTRAGDETIHDYMDLATAVKKLVMKELS